MRKFTAILIVALAFMPSSLWAQEYTPGDVIVVLRPSGEITASSFGASGAETLRASEFAASSGASVSAIYPDLSQAGNGIFMLIHSDSQDAEDLSAILLENPEVLAASPNYTVQAAQIPNDTYYPDCWGMTDINAPEAWDITTGSSSVYVAVIDSGIDDTNPDLTANVATEYSYNTVNPGASARDDYGHGTHVAGTIGAKGNNGIGVAGVNWGVSLISVKALNSSGSGTFTTVINALNYVVSLINQGVNIKAVNMSLETYIDMTPTHDNCVKQPLWRAFKALDDTNKAVIVVAAGNHSQIIGQPSTGYHDSTVNRSGLYVYPPSFPGLYNMISVSALSRLGTTAYYSNTGADISAPGGMLSSLLDSAGIISTWLQSATQYIESDGVSLRSIQGTSMAAPHIAGAAALIASYAPGLTAYQLKQVILSGSNSSSSSVNASSGGVLDIRAAMDYQAASGSTIPAQGTEWADYDDYKSYEADESMNYGGGGGGSGCDGLTVGFWGVLVAAMLARKRMSW